MGFIDTLKEKAELAKQTDQGSKKSKPKAKKAPKKKLIERMGVKVEKQETQEESAEKERHTQIATVWAYLRGEIDRGIQEYFKSGETSILREHVGRPALDALLDELKKMRSQGIHWSQPDRKTKTQPRIQVIGEQLDPNTKQPVKFTVQERYRDYSQLRALDGSLPDRTCEGEERVIRATVEVKNGQEFRLLTIHKVTGAVL